MTIIHTRPLPHDGRLGRHVEHDSRSLRYLYPRTATDWTPIRHHTDAPVLDQGGLGACTGYAAAHRLGHGILPPDMITDELARALYSEATSLDIFPGVWPPEDTGSSGLAVAKAAANAGYIGGYQHITAPEQLAAALAVAPVLVGTAWYGSMFQPIRDGLVNVDTDSGLYGGHEYLCDEYTESGYLGFQNSWGPGWGKEGRFYIERDDFLALLADQGDATVFTAHVPTPDPSPDAKGCLAALARALTGRRS